MKIQEIRFSYFSCCVDNVSWFKKKKCLKKKVILDPSSRVQSLMVRKSWWQGCETAGQAILRFRDQTTRGSHAQLVFSFSHSSGPKQGAVLLSFRVGLPTSANIK